MWPKCKEARTTGAFGPVVLLGRGAWGGLRHAGRAVLSNSIGFFSQVLFGYRTTTPIDLALTAIFAACVISWMLLLSPKGEEIRVTLVRFSPEQEERILRHLESLNKTMLKVSRN